MKCAIYTERQPPPWAHFQHDGPFSVPDSSFPVPMAHFQFQVAYFTEKTILKKEILSD
jgi:hypothetical protein